MPRIAIVTAQAARGLDEDQPPLEAALRARGVEYAVVDWDSRSVDWSRFDLAVLRSTWDYTQRLAEFLAWADAVSKLTRLVNPARVVRWNTDKHYLNDLAASGVPTIPGDFVEPGEDAAGGLRAFLDRHSESAEFVVKPAVGAGSRDTQRYGREDEAAAIAHIARLTAAGRSALIQPYLPSVDRDGETALMHFAGKLSHAIRKGPLLRRGAPPMRALFAAEHIERRSPAADERDVARRALAAIPFGLLPYARVDLIRDGEGEPRVLELELTEPSLFFAHGDGAADAFADAILDAADAGS